MKTVLIAGGSGLIGKKLNQTLSKKGYKVYTLTRTAKHRGQIYWNPAQQTIEGKHLDKINIIINLTGENIGEKRWTKERKKALRDSRVKTTQFLHSLVANIPNLEYYISASGINCYPQEDKIHVESDEYGTDFLAKLVKEWEAVSDLFKSNCKVAKLRISMVLSKRGGALDKMLLPVKLGLGSPIGSGEQIMPWIHIDDLCNMFVFAIENQLTGVYNAAANCDTNKDFMKALAKALKRPFFMPKVPAFLLKLMLGEMSALVLDSTNASNEKIKQAGFEFEHEDIETTLAVLLKRSN
jgi:uncharacterized protein (TIGR01777 family)